MRDTPRPRDSGPSGRDGQPSTGGELARLIEAEDRLERKLAEARAAAEEMVRRAETEASAAREQADSEIGTALEELGRRLDDELEQRIEEIERERARAVARYDGLSGEELERCVQHVLGRLVGRPTEEPEP